MSTMTVSRDIMHAINDVKASYYLKKFQAMPNTMTTMVSKKLVERNSDVMEFYPNSNRYSVHDLVTSLTFTNTSL